MMVCSKQSYGSLEGKRLFRIPQKDNKNQENSHSLLHCVYIYIYINIQLLYKFGIVQTSHFQVSRCCAGSTEAMLVWKQLLGKITQYKKDYLNRSSPHPSFHPNRNQTTRKCPQYCSTKTKGSNWPFTPGVCSWFSGSSRLIGSCCLSSFQRAGD